MKVFKKHLKWSLGSVNFYAIKLVYFKCTLTFSFRVLVYIAMSFDNSMFVLHIMMIIGKANLFRILLTFTHRMIILTSNML